MQRFVPRFGALALLLALSSSAGPASAWRAEADGGAARDDRVRALAVDAAGDILTAGSLARSGTGQDFAVTKRASGTGLPLWQVVIDGADPNEVGTTDGARAVVIDPNGDVIAVGQLANGISGADLFVIKLSGATGTELWRYELDGSAGAADAARAIALDAAGDAFVAGFVLNATTDQDFLVVKLSGATGAELWRHEVDAGAGTQDRANAVAVDTMGDVIAAGFLRFAGGDQRMAAIKLSGAEGSELWLRALRGSDPNGALGENEAHAIALTATGDPVLAGTLLNRGTGSDFSVVRLSGSSGVEAWRAELDGSLDPDFDEATSLVLEATGDAVAAGVLWNTGTGLDFTVARFSGTTGALAWQTEIDGSDGFGDRASAVALDGVGTVVAAGLVVNSGTGVDFAVAGLDVSSGTVSWRRDLRGSRTSGDDNGLAITTDPENRVIAAGFVGNQATQLDQFIVQLGSADGRTTPVCGDVSLDERLEGGDVGRYRGFLADPLDRSLSAQERTRCSVIGSATACGLLDVVVLRRALFDAGLNPGIAPVCLALSSP